MILMMRKPGDMLLGSEIVARLDGWVVEYALEREQKYTIRCKISRHSNIKQTLQKSPFPFSKTLGIKLNSLRFCAKHNRTVFMIS